MNIQWLIIRLGSAAKQVPGIFIMSWTTILQLYRWWRSWRVYGNVQHHGSVNRNDSGRGKDLQLCHTVDDLHTLWSIGLLNPRQSRKKRASNFPHNNAPWSMLAWSENNVEYCSCLMKDKYYSGRWKDTSFPQITQTVNISVHLNRLKYSTSLNEVSMHIIY